MKAYEVEQAERGTNNWFKLGWDYVSLSKAEAKQWASKRGAEYTGLKHRVVTITVTAQSAMGEKETHENQGACSAPERRLERPV